MNEWYELWSKAGATPGERVTNPDLYIKEFNWVANWFDNYFFNKVSDFLLGLIFAGLLVLSSFYYFSKKVKINIKKRKYLIIYLILFILFFEWFYNHPALRYGGFCLIFLILFIPFSLFLEKINIGDIKFVKLSNIFISLTILIFFARNVDRLYDEIKIYDYNPLTYTFYNVETQHFRINKQINDLINYYEICSKSSEECIFKSSIKIKKQKNKYIIYKK